MEKRSKIQPLKDFAESLVHQAMLLQWMVQRLDAELGDDIIIPIDTESKHLPQRRRQLPRPLKLIGNGNYPGNNAVR